MKKQRYLFLYLTLLCFLGLVAIFIVDGYMGIYDTIRITAGEYEQPIDPDFWLRGRGVWSTGIGWGERALYRYEIDNRQFSTYETKVEVSVWQSQQKVKDITSQSLKIDPFRKAQLEWTIDTRELLPGGPPVQQSYQYAVVIKRGDVERRTILNVNPGASPLPPKPLPTVPR